MGYCFPNSECLGVPNDGRILKAIVLLVGFQYGPVLEMLLVHGAVVVRREEDPLAFVGCLEVHWAALEAAELVVFATRLC